MTKVQNILTLSDTDFMELVLKLKPGINFKPWNPYYEYEDNEADISFFVSQDEKSLTMWTGDKYEDVEFTPRQIKHLETICPKITDTWEEPYHPYKGALRYSPKKSKL